MENSIRKKEIFVFIITLILIAGISASGRLLQYVNILWLRLFLNCFIFVVMYAVCLIALKLTDSLYIIKINKKNLGFQILWVFIIAIGLAFFIGFLPTLFNTSLIGGHNNYKLWHLFYNAFFYIILVGIVEETIFRGYIQEQLIKWLGNKKILAPLFAAMLFGLWHLINGDFMQCLFTFGIGSVLGYLKYFVKNCSLLSVSLGHGLYDYLLFLLRCFVI